MKTFKIIVIVALLYAVFGRLALFLAVPPGYASPVWPAAGIALAFMLRYGYRIWPGIFFGSVLVNIWTSFDASTVQSIMTSVLLALSIGAGAALQAVMGRRLVGIFVPKEVILVNFEDTFKVMFWGGVVSCIVSPSVGVVSLIIFGAIPADGSIINWLTWWVGDAIGVFLFLPVVLSWIGESKEEWKKRRLSLTGSLTIVMMVIAGIVYFGYFSENKRLESIFENEADQFSKAIQYKIREYHVMLDSVQSFFNSSQEVERDEFSTFLQGVRRKLPAARSVAWVPRITKEEIPRYIESAAADGLPDYHIKEVGPDGKLRPAGERDVYYPIFYIEPQTGNEVALGIDNGSEPYRMEATMAATDTGIAMASAPVVLGQDVKQGHLSLLLIMPVYKQAAALNTVEDRRENIKGYVTVTTRIKDFIEKALLISPFEEYIQVFIYDTASGRDEPVYVRKKAGAKSVSDKIQLSLPLDVAGRKWQLIFQPTLEFYAQHQTWGLWFILIGALLISSLFNVLILFVTGQTFEVTRVVDRRTRELKESQKLLEEQNNMKEKIAQDLTAQSAKLQEQKGAMLNLLDDAEQAREEAMQTAEKITNIIKTASEAFISINQIGRIIEWNPQAEKIFGWSRKEVINKELAEIIIPQEMRDAHRKGMKHFLETGQGSVMGKQIELQGLHRDGHLFPVELTISAQQIKEGIIFNSFLRDITQRKRDEEILQKMTSELARSNKELESFAYVASHDLQEPVRMVASYGQLLETRFKDKLDGDALVFLTYIVDGGKRMQSLVSDLLQYSRVGTQTKPFQKTDLNDVIQNALDNLQVAIQERKAKICVDRMPIVMADDVQMIQLVQNLIANALKYQPADNIPKITVSVQDKDKEWVFSFKDNGIGIDPKFYDKIFIIFQRLHKREEYSGTGVGLALCKRIVEKHGGKIWVDSKPGEGTEFLFSFPKLNEGGVT